MKKINFLLLLLPVTLFTACAPKEKSNTPETTTSTTVDFEKEKAAILKVLEAESTAFWKKDFDGFASCWLHEDYVRTMGWWQQGGVTVIEGWQETGRRIKSHMETSPAPNATATQVRRENINLRIYPEVAWMTFDQYGADTGDTLMDMVGLSRETRIFEKHNGQWKIAYVGWLLEGAKKAN